MRIRAEAALVGDLDGMRRWATAIGARYMGAVPAEYLVRARITGVIAERAIAD